MKDYKMKITGYRKKLIKQLKKICPEIAESDSVVNCYGYLYVRWLDNKWYWKGSDEQNRLFFEKHELPEITPKQFIKKFKRNHAYNTMLKTSSYCKVTQKQNMVIQKLWFKLGGAWPSGGTEISDTHSPVLLFNNVTGGEKSLLKDLSFNVNNGWIKEEDVIKLKAKKVIKQLKKLVKEQNK